MRKNPIYGFTVIWLIAVALFWLLDIEFDTALLLALLYLSIGANIKFLFEDRIREAYSTLWRRTFYRWMRDDDVALDDEIAKGPTKFGRRPPGWLGFRKNGMLFEFQVVNMGEFLRIYILSHPPYRELSPSAHDAHRYYDRQNGLHYVCVSTRQPLKNLRDAMEVARAWAAYTEHYIRTGERLTG